MIPALLFITYTLFSRKQQGNLQTEPRLEDRVSQINCGIHEKVRVILYVSSETQWNTYLFPETDFHVLECAFYLCKVYNVLILNVLIHKIKQLMQVEQQ